MGSMKGVFTEIILCIGPNICHSAGLHLELYDELYRVKVGSCHQGKARPRVVDGGTVYNTERSNEYIE